MSLVTISVKQDGGGTQFLFRFYGNAAWESWIIFLYDSIFLAGIESKPVANETKSFRLEAQGSHSATEIQDGTTGSWSSRSRGVWIVQATEDQMQWRDTGLPAMRGVEYTLWISGAMERTNSHVCLLFLCFGEKSGGWPPSTVENWAVYLQKLRTMRIYWRISVPMSTVELQIVF